MVMNEGYSRKGYEEASEERLGLLMAGITPGTPR